jgi:CheY-like chemotaxis protein
MRRPAPSQQQNQSFDGLGLISELIDGPAHISLRQLVFALDNDRFSGRTESGKWWDPQMQSELNILHLEEDRLDAELIRDTLCADGILANIVRVETEVEFRCAILKGGFHLILADYSTPGFDGMSALRILQEVNPALPFIVVSGTIGEEIAVETLKSGATDCVLKNRLQRLGMSVRRALAEAEERSSRKVTDLALRESEIRYRRLFESAQDGIMILDAESGQIIEVNKANSA